MLVYTTHFCHFWQVLGDALSWDLPHSSFLYDHPIVICMIVGVYIYEIIWICVCVWFDLRMVTGMQPMVFNPHRHRCLGMVRSTRNWSRFLGQFQLLKLRALSDATVGTMWKFFRERHGKTMISLANSVVEWKKPWNSVFERGNTIDFNHVRGKRLIFINDNIW